MEGSFIDFGIKLEINANPEIRVFGYENEFAQVILNLFSNSRDAFKIIKKSNPTIKVKIYQENDKSVIIITDNAGGIPQNIIDKIFTTGITTKDRGTGMGLLMSKKIIDGMNGTIKVQNISEGAEFTIVL